MTSLSGYTAMTSTNEIPAVMTFAAACRLWGLATGSLFNHVRRNQFLAGEAWQSAGIGTPWLVTREAMYRLHGQPGQTGQTSTRRPRR